MITHDLAPFLIGRDASDVPALNEAMDYVGRGGVLSFSISAIDIALWDLKLTLPGVPLVQAADGASDRCRAYGGGIYLALYLPKFLAQTQRYLDGGLDVIKIKVCQPKLAEDVEHIVAVREFLGPDRAFMIGANYALTTDQAIGMVCAAAPNDITWFEKPVIPEDLGPCATIREMGGIKTAQGKNLHTMHEFSRAMPDGRFDYI